LGFLIPSVGESLCLRRHLCQSPNGTELISHGFKPFFSLGFGVA
jgi:hypothetical protein